MLDFLRKKKTNFTEIISVLIDHIRQIKDKKNSIPEDVFDVTIFSLEEILSTFESMDTLIEKNDIGGCLKLSRTILENSINLRYIYKEDIESRAKNFKTESIKKLSEKFESLDEYTPEAKEMYDYFQKLLKDYVPDKKKIRDKFKEVNSDSTYVRSYKRLSEYIHPTYRHQKIDFSKNTPYILELKRTVRSDTCIIALTALMDVCIKYDLNGGGMIIEEPEYKGTVFFSTNPLKNI
jgi:hypothetical protein